MCLLAPVEVVPRGVVRLQDLDVGDLGWRAPQPGREFDLADSRV